MPGGDAKLTLTERFDYGALSFIINNFSSFNFRPETDPKETLAMIRRYKAASSPDGTHRVTYRRATPGHGRYFAERGLSLQAMAREIRNAIAYPFYDDLDFHNCHPTLLMQHCQNRGVPCPRLEDYCRRRGGVMAELDPSEGHPAAKAAVLAVINGGSGEPSRRDLDSIQEVGEEWMASFTNEMRAVREVLVGASDSVYLKMARKKKKRPGNVLGAAVNLLLCDLENDALMALREFVETTSRRVGVLVFDGCMVEKRRPGEEEEDDGGMLVSASDFVFERTGYRLCIKVKDMTLDKLDVPLTVYGGVGGVPRAPRFAEDDVGAGRVFLEDLGASVTSCWACVWVRNGPVWTDEADMVHKLLTSRCMGSNIMRITERGDVSPMSGNMPTVRRIVEAATALIPEDPGFRRRMWESNIGCVCYLDGLYDFRRGRFFTYEERPDVLPRQCIQRDFPAERPPDSVFAELYERVLVSTLGAADRIETYLALIARATAGEYGDKQFVAAMGERNSGKGLVQELNQSAWECYVNTVNANAFLLQQSASSDAAKSLSWALDCEYARQTYTNEVKCDASSRSIKLDGNLLKSFQSGGDTMSARKNFKDERTFRVSTKLIMNLNDIPSVTPRDAVSTMVLLKFPFKFVSAEELHSAAALPYHRLRDESLKNDFIKRADVVAAFTWMVIDAYRPNPVVPCASIREDTMGYREDIGDDAAVLSRCFKVTGDREDFVLVKQLAVVARGNGMSITALKDRLGKMGGFYDNNCCVHGRRNGRGFMGVRMLEDVDDISPDTSSASERKFRAALEQETGRTYAKARPLWLVNPETGMSLELDMYDAERKQAVEYDGPQHYMYPNGVHGSREEYERQYARDRVKDVACYGHGVNLIRVRAGASVAEEMAEWRMKAFTR